MTYLKIKYESSCGPVHCSLIQIAFIWKLGESQNSRPRLVASDNFTHETGEADWQVRCDVVAPMASVRISVSALDSRCWSPGTTSKSLFSSSSNAGFFKCSLSFGCSAHSAWTPSIGPVYWNFSVRVSSSFSLKVRFGELIFIWIWSKWWIFNK